MRGSERDRKIMQRIRSNFDRAANVYAHFESRTAFFEMLVDRLVGSAPPLAGGRVLDVGCGSGASLKPLRRAVGPFGLAVGLDLSLGMLKEARRRMGPGVPLVQGDGGAVDRLFSKKFDAVVFNAVLFMIPDGRAALASAQQVLRPGGVVLASVLEGAHIVPDGHPLPEELHKRGVPVGRHAVTRWEEIERSLGELFQDVRTERLSIELDAEGFLDFYEMEPMAAGLMPELPQTERVKVLREFSADIGAKGLRIAQHWQLATATKAV